MFLVWNNLLFTRNIFSGDLRCFSWPSAPCCSWRACSYPCRWSCSAWWRTTASPSSPPVRCKAEALTGKSMSERSANRPVVCQLEESGNNLINKNNLILNLKCLKLFIAIGTIRIKKVKCSTVSVTKNRFVI